MTGSIRPSFTALFSLDTPNILSEANSLASALGCPFLDKLPGLFSTRVHFSSGMLHVLAPDTVKLKQMQNCRRVTLDLLSA